jgi:hypothetical protein
MKKSDKKPVSEKRMEPASFSPDHSMILAKIMELYDGLFDHAGYGSMKIEMRFLKKGQKEIIVSCGKDFRYVVDWPEPEFCRFCNRDQCTLAEGEDGRRE